MKQGFLKIKIFFQCSYKTRQYFQKVITDLLVGKDHTRDFEVKNAELASKGYHVGTNFRSSEIFQFRDRCFYRSRPMQETKRMFQRKYPMFIYKINIDGRNQRIKKPRFLTLPASSEHLFFGVPETKKSHPESKTNKRILTFLIVDFRIENLEKVDEINSS